MSLLSTLPSSDQVPSEAGASHALMRMTGLGTRETVEAVHPGLREGREGAEFDGPRPDEVLAGVLEGEAVASGILGAPFILPVSFFKVLVTAIDAIGVIPVVRDLEACAAVVARIEDGLPGATRLGPSLAPFAKGLILLATAEVMRDEKPVLAEMIFGSNGRTHAAAFRQVLNPTQNRQGHRRRASLDQLQTLPNEMALEAWRAFEAWAMIAPDERTLSDRMKVLEGAPDAWSAEFPDWRQKRLEAMGQTNLDAILPKEPEAFSVFAVGQPLEESQRALMVEIIRKGLGGRCTNRPDREGAILSAFNTIASWKAMVGKEDAITLAGELCSDLVLAGVPFPLYGLPDRVAEEESWVIDGLRFLTKSFRGEPEFPAVYAMFAALMSEWDRENRYPAPTNAIMHSHAGVILGNLDRIPEILALLDKDLPLEHAPWVEADAVVSALGLALLSGGQMPAVRKSLAQVVAFADERGLQIA